MDDIKSDNMEAAVSGKTRSSEGISVRQIAIDGMFIALTLLFTAFINVRLPIAAQGGLIHLGNVPLYIGAVLFGRRTGALAGALGMGLFDILTGWAAYAPFTFVIAGFMGYLIGVIAERHRNIAWYALAFGLAMAIKAVGYYLAEVILYHNWMTPLASIPGNLIQTGMAMVVVLLVIAPLERVVRRGIE